MISAQAELPYHWYASHHHGDGAGHQHFPVDGDSEEHTGVPLVPYEPEPTTLDGLFKEDPEALSQALTQIRATNRQIFDAIIRNNARPDPNSVALLRLETLLEHIYGTENSAARLHFEIAFEQRMEHVLNQMLNQALRAKILAPVPGSPGVNGAGLIKPPGAGR